MEFEGSLPCSQEPSTGRYPEPDQSSPAYLSNSSNLWLLFDGKMEDFSKFSQYWEVLFLCLQLLMCV
jgi:hypothetical protein